MMTAITTLIKTKIKMLTKSLKFGDSINLKTQKKSPLIFQVIHSIKSATQYPVVTDVA